MIYFYGVRNIWVNESDLVSGENGNENDGVIYVGIDFYHDEQCLP